MEIKLTADGSHTIYNDAIDETYHSVNGAIAESEHIFIKNGLARFPGRHIRVLEIGFGTGLNALLAYSYAVENQISLFYDTTELYPLNREIWSKLNYCSFLPNDYGLIYNILHESAWDEVHLLGSGFQFRKNRVNALDYRTDNIYDVVFMDAFSPDKEPDLWSAAFFGQLHSLMSANALLVSYSAKGTVKQNLRAAGFQVSRLPGPPGKRHIVLAQKSGS